MPEIKPYNIPIFKTKKKHFGKLRENAEDLGEWLLQVLVSIPIIALIFWICNSLENHQNKIEKRYGFVYITPDYYLFTPCFMEVLMIKKVQPGGAFSKAGLKKRDVIWNYPSDPKARIERILDKPKGTKIMFEIIPGEKFKPRCNFDAKLKTEIRIVVAP